MKQDKLFKLKRFLKQLRLLWFVADAKTFWKFIWSLFVTLPDNIKNLNVNAGFDKMIGYQCVFNVLGHKILLDGKWLGYAIDTYVKLDYIRPPHIVLKEGMTVVDIGAAGGDFTILAGLICKKVIAIEAIAESVKNLKENIKLNKCTAEITVIRGLVGYNSGFESKKTSNNVSGDNSPPKLDMNNILADYDKVDFLKIDIEGSEFDLLNCNTEWLDKIDKIAMETHSEFGDPNQIKRILERRGFEVTAIKNTPIRGLMYARRL